MKKPIASFLIFLLLLQSLITPFFVSPVYALNDTTTTWTFNTANAGTYTYDSNLVTVDNDGAHPASGVNKITNPAFASDISSWNTTSIAPSGWVEVPGNASYSTTNFLAMQYEAKYDCTGDDDGDTAAACTATADLGLGLDYRDIASFATTNVVSTANGAPIVHITHNQAITACPAGYHLINNNEWMTIARNAEDQTTNWANGTVGSLVSAGGGLKRGNVGNADSVGYNGTDPEYGTGRDSKAMLTLSNGSTIWDISGNVWDHVNFDANDNGTYNEAADLLSDQDHPEATDGTTTRTGFNSSGFTSADPDSTWYLSNNGSGDFGYVDFRPEDTTLTALNGVGRIYHNSNSASTTKNRVFLRGGPWIEGIDSGAFALTLLWTTTTQVYNIGYRCASDPVTISQSFSSSSGRSGTGGNTITIGSVSDGKLYQSVNVGDTSSYDFSAYVYDSTSGNDGGTVNGTIASLWYNGATISTTYTSAGSGWWKLSGTLTGANASREYGVAIETGKTIKADDFTLSKQGTYSVYNTSAYENNNVQSWDSFSATDTASGNASTVYQLCTDDGSTCQSGSSWKYYDGDSWETASNTTTHVNTEAQLTQTAMQALPTTSKKLSVKAIFVFGGLDTPELDTVTVGLTSDTAAPTISLTALSPDPTTDTTPALTGTATEDIDTVSTVEFQIDSTAGSWTTCTATDGAFDEISEAFTCTVSTALTDGSHTMYVRATDSNSNTTASGSESSDAFTVDTTSPLSFDLQDPGSNAYISADRPTFKWKGTSDSTAGLSKYVLEVDNGESGDFTIDDIPVSRTSDYETSKYVIRYENFGDSDITNNYISVWTKSSLDWETDHNDGKLKEGKRNWTIKVRDNAGNERSEGRTLFIDQKGPSLNLTQINEAAFSSNAFSTTDKTPTIFGKITDVLSGDTSSTSETIKQDNKVVSGPKQVEVKLEKKNVDGTYILDTITNVALSETYWTSNGTKITDNSQQKSDKYSTFEFTPSVALPLGNYRLTLTGKDNAGNSGGEQVLTITVGTFAQLVAPHELQVVEEEIEITKPEEPTKEAGAPKMNPFAGIARFFGNLEAYFAQVGQQGSRALAEGTQQPRKFVSSLGEWISYSTTSFGEIVLDDKPTQISDVRVEQLTPDSAVITWKTNHMATSKVNYGLTKDFGQDVQTHKKVHDHRLEVTGLEPGILYYYEVMSQNKNYVFDANHEFTTPTE